MVHFPNATIYIATLSQEVNEEGTCINEYDYKNPLDTFRADVQPNNLTREQIDLYGINEKTSKTKKVFYTKSVFMLSGNRAKVVYDNGTIEFYNICPVNEWRVHCEALLIPVENEEQEEEDENDNENDDEDNSEDNGEYEG